MLEVLDRQAYFRAKVSSSASATRSTTTSPYSLEPNVKESPGGLRDLQMILWLARAPGSARTWTELATPRADHAATRPTLSAPANAA